MKYLLIALALLGASCAAAQPQDRPPVSAEAVARRDRSHTRLEAEKVPINRHLPVLEDSREALRRSPEEVAVRALALLAVSMKASGAPEEVWRGFTRDFGLEKNFTSEEADFMADPDPDDHDKQQLSWRLEAACTLLWAIGRLEKLDRPEEECTANQVMPLVRNVDRAGFIAAAKLRPIGDILDQADLIYRYRWALVDIQVGGKPVPDWLSGDIAVERHHAFNWLVMNPAEDWDDVPLDT